MSEYLTIPTWLQDRPHSQVRPPIQTRPQLLPLSELRWEDFERLCLRLAQSRGQVIHCQVYGVRGQSQSGIDIYSRTADDGYVVYECKQAKRFAAGHIRSAVERFRAGRWYRKSSVFVLCTAKSMASVTLASELERQNDALQADGKSLLAWDQEQISAMLKNQPDIVEDFFGPVWRDRFCPGSTSTSAERPAARLSEMSHRGILPQEVDYSARVENFLAYHLRPLGHAERLTGRDDEFVELDQWLDNRSTPYAFLIGSPGCGKSGSPDPGVDGRSRDLVVIAG